MKRRFSTLCSPKNWRISALVGTGMWLLATMLPTSARALEAFENDRMKSQLNLHLVSELCRDRDNPMAELPTPNTSDIVAKQQRLAIERTQDQVLRLKLRQAYFHYLGCRDSKD